MDNGGSDELIVIARAVRTHGLRGEIVAELLTDFPERFEDVDELILVAPAGGQTAGEQKRAQLEDFRFQKDRVVLKLTGYDDVERAKELIGYDFALPDSERVPLEEDEFYDWELEGCTVKAGDQSIGEVRSVLKTGGAEILVISDDSGKEQLVPLAAEIVVKIDTAARVILIDPPEGLLDL